MKIKLVNHRPLVSNGLDLCFAITAKSAPIGLTSTPVIGTGITLNVSYKLSDFLVNGAGEIECEYINSARLYVGYGTLPTNPAGNIAPTPDGNQYFGWAEFSSWTADTCVWINLSNVDIVGLPLTLSSATWSLGYKESANSIIDSMMKSFPGCNVSTPINNKVVGPDINSKPYISFDKYLNYLNKSIAGLSINSDTLSDGTQKTFVGHFSPSYSAITLTSNSGDNFTLYYSAFTSDIIYRGDGATILYNGVTIPQNRSGKTDDVISSNSVFRNLVIGMNEGYFQGNPSYSNGINYSLNYSYQEPFNYLPALSGRVGNMYANIIHQASNSYGFAYADSNLKTLIQSPKSDEITLSIVCDDDVMGYYENTLSSQSCPGWGPYQFAFGLGTTLGDIKVGNCRYSGATSYCGAGSFLPIVDEWVKMEFLGTKGKYIWVRPSTLDVVDWYTKGDGSTGHCLSGQWIITPVSVPAGNKITWGAYVKWNRGAKNPDKPNF